MCSISSTWVSIYNLLYIQIRSVNNEIIIFFCNRCKARVRTEDENGKIELINSHNHDIITERRKKGALKAMMELKKEQKMITKTERIKSEKASDEESH